MIDDGVCVGVPLHTTIVRLQVQIEYTRAATCIGLPVSCTMTTREIGGGSGRMSRDGRKTSPEPLARRHCDSLSRCTIPLPHQVI